MDVLERFVSGDLDAFEALFRLHSHEVAGWVLRIVRDRTVADELTIEVFWRIYRARARFDPQRPFGAWARRIATNVAFDYLKHARRDIQLGEPHGQCPSDTVVQNEMRSQIRHAFGQLSPKLRVVATMALVEETPHREIAEALGISVSAVKTRIFRATRQLRRSLRHMGCEQ